jgi:hypothetical protein
MPKESLEHRQDAYEPIRRLLFGLLSAAAVACALARSLGIKDVDRDVLYFLVAACAFLVLERIKRFSVGKEGISAELAESIKREISSVTEKAVEEVGQAAVVGAIVAKEGVGKAREDKPQDESIATLLARLPPPGQVDRTDPQKGRFGGLPERNGRRLDVDVRPSLSTLGIYRIKLKVYSTDTINPLNGEVLFFLHNTFERDVRSVPVKDGVARLDLLSYGAFTVGAIADNGETFLELDLALDERFPKEFRER